MSSLILILITGVGLGALYFLVASGLSLIYGLMHVLNFAHGAFLTAGAYAAWVATAYLSGLGGWSFPVAVLIGMVVGALIGAAVEFFLIRPLYRRHIEQVLVTVGLGLMAVALFTGIWGPDPQPFPRPAWTTQTTTIGGAAIPNDRFLLIGAAGLLLVGLVLLLKYTRIGLIIRAGVENRTMVQALGIDVRRTFTLVFALGGAAAALGGVLGSVYLGSVSPGQGTALLIYAFICLVTGGIALSYDILFGRTGLLSFGHALFVGAGAYSAAIALGKWGGGLGLAVLMVLAMGIALPLIVGSIALRVKGIAFAMVTLAFAQAVAITVLRNPGGLTGGEEGLSLNRSQLPAVLSGVVNAPYRYWLALAFCLFCFLVVAWLTTARTGHAWAAVRENEARVEVLGMSGYRTKLTAVVVGGFLGTLGGFIQLIVIGGANPHLLSTEFTLSLLIMVVLGGAGSRWGAIVGGALYVLLDNRLQELSTSETIAGLPAVLRVPLSQPVFVLGLLFVLVVYFAPGGIAAIGGRVRAGWIARQRRRRDSPRASEGGVTPAE